MDGNLHLAVLHTLGRSKAQCKAQWRWETRGVVTVEVGPDKALLLRLSGQIFRELISFNLRERDGFERAVRKVKMGIGWCRRA